MQITARLLTAATRQRVLSTSACLAAAAPGPWLRWLSTSSDTLQHAGTPSLSSSGSALPDGDPQSIKLVRSYDIKGTPLSQAVAMMLSAGQLPREELVSNLDVLCGDLLDVGVGAHSTTELSAFCEVLRQVNHAPQPVLRAILSHLAGVTSDSAAAGTTTSSSSSSGAGSVQAPVRSMQVDEMPSVMWAAARVGQALEASKAANSSGNRGSREQGSYSGSAQDAATIQQQQPCSVPEEGVAHVLDVCITEASAVLGGDVGGLAPEELPCCMQALADLGYEDPFLLTLLSEACQEAMPEFSTQELQQLVQACVDMARWFYDGTLLKSLEGAVADKAAHFQPEVAARIEQQLMSLRHKGHRQQLEQAGGVEEGRRNVLRQRLRERKARDSSS